MAFSLLPKEDQYFALFSQMGTKIQEAAVILAQHLKGITGEHDLARCRCVEHQCREHLRHGRGHGRHLAAEAVEGALRATLGILVAGKAGQPQQV